jgi:hypothetical protein
MPTASTTSDRRPHPGPRHSGPRPAAPRPAAPQAESGRPGPPRRRRRGLGRRATLAIWAACLAGGVGIGVLTDGGDRSPAAPRGRSEPASEGTNADAAGWQAPAEGEASREREAPPEASGGSAAREDGDGEAAADRSDPPTSRPSRHTPHGSRLDDIDGRDARAIIESVLPGIVIPSFDGRPGGSTTTTEPPSPPGDSTTTTEPPSTTTTSSVPPDTGGGPGPVITGVPTARSR